VLCFKNGSRFKSEGAGQLRVLPTMDWQPTPYVTSHDRAKIGQPPRLPQRIMGPGPIGRDATARGQVVLRSSHRGSKSQGAGQRRTAARWSPAGSVSEPARPETAGNTPQGLTSRIMASRPDRESWDSDEEKNPAKPHANP
jgi:predicted nucleic acid-binding Zn ribbon protein